MKWVKVVGLISRSLLNEINFLPMKLKSIEEAQTAFPDQEQFRLALVDDVHDNTELFSLIPPLDLLEACGAEAGEMDDFCISQVPSSRAAMNRGDSFGWYFIYTYKIEGKKRRKIYFKTEHGCGGVMDNCDGPLTRIIKPSKKL